MDLSWLSMLGIAVGLAADAFAVAIVVGATLKMVTPRHVFRLAFHFGLFQSLMPVIGWGAGEFLAAQIHEYDHWVAFGLLCYVGGKMFWEARGKKKTETCTDPTRGMRLLSLSVATSLDALAVGISMAFMGVSVWFPSVIIGLVTAALTSAGIFFGCRIGSRWGQWAEIAGGIVLILIGFKVLLVG
jgi:manganese efflux pump family protein